jgi:hypothetical protein
VQQVGNNNTIIVRQVGNKSCTCNADARDACNIKIVKQEFVDLSHDMST